jgi:hypothetical protein
MLAGRIAVLGKILTIAKDWLTKDPADPGFGACVTCHVFISFRFF